MLAFAESARAGWVNVNASTNYWEPHLPFGGRSGSASGRGRVGGRCVLDAFTETKTVILPAPRPPDGTAPSRGNRAVSHPGGHFTRSNARCGRAPLAAGDLRGNIAGSSTVLASPGWPARWPTIWPVTIWPLTI